MTKFYEYDRWWYTKRLEVEEDRQPGEQVWYDKGMEAYYIIIPKKKPFWCI